MPSFKVTVEGANYPEHFMVEAENAEAAADIAEANSGCPVERVEQLSQPNVSLDEANLELQGVAHEQDEDYLFYDEDDEDDLLDYEDDGQPDEYTEWQDYMGGDEYYDHSENNGFFD